ncbi:MAG: ABC transporter ATP-binding protein [Saprospirales bacterium]|nr:ABC transporter ATP-binding protein [Saprospirales bacterium]
MVWKTSPGLAISNASLRLLKSGIPVSTLYVGKLIIDEVIFLMGHPDASRQQLWLWVGVELGLALISEVISRGINLAEGMLGDLFANKTSAEIMRHAATLDLYHFENADFYDKMERARQQTYGRTVLLSMILSQVEDFITILFLGIGLAAFNPWLLLILFVAVLPAFAGESYFNQKSYSLTRSWTPERRELDYLRFIGASDATAKEVKLFGLADFLANRFEELAQKYYEANRKLSLRRAVWGTGLSGLATLAYYGAYVFILIQTVGGTLTVGTLTFLAGSFARMRGLLQGIMGRFSKIAESALYLQDLFDFFAIQPIIENTKNARMVPNPIVKGFVFEGVSFKYPQAERWAIRDLSFELRAGEKLALVGENGAGKTTLVKLLARLYEPTEGRILLDGVDIREYNPESLRASIGVIFQDYQRFQLKVRENIAVGDIEQREDDLRIQDAALKSLADSVVNGLPQGYEQRLGRRFAEGVELSGGQWQKIALARAYMRDAQLYILDEPTSALDARAEYEVFQRFAKLIEGKTAVLISHRFSTVRMADRILVLENGQLTELGSHEELLEKGGMYAELFHLQAQGYQ